VCCATCVLGWLHIAACSPTRRTLTIATTTSVHNSGLLDVVLPAYRGATGIEVRVHAAGSGRALQMLGENLAELVISHAPAAEAAALAAHPRWIKRRLAHNWFVVVGPRADPANIRSAMDAVDAFRRIERSTATFVSRGDESGTHEREMVLWEEAGATPKGARYIVSGRGMALALRHTDEVQGYTLSDEATYLQLAPGLELDPLYRGDPRLLNVYSVIHPAGESAAEHFADWLITGDGRELIARFTVAGRAVFEVDSP
jgi:tungstate transport system substrate-binding protein